MTAEAVHRIFVWSVVTLAVVLAGAFVGAVAGIMSLCAGDGPEFPY